MATLGGNVGALGPYYLERWCLGSNPEATGEDPGNT